MGKDHDHDDFQESVLRRLKQIEAWLVLIYIKEVTMSKLGQDLLDAVTQETSAVDSLIALIQGKINDNTLSAEEGAALLADIASNRDKLEAAILANTTPPPQP